MPSGQGVFLTVNLSTGSITFTLEGTDAQLDGLDVLQLAEITRAEMQKMTLPLTGGSYTLHEPLKGQVSAPFEIAAGPERPEVSKAGGADLVCRRCGKTGHVAQRDSVDPDQPGGRNCRIAIGQQNGELSPPPPASKAGGGEPPHNAQTGRFGSCTHGVALALDCEACALDAAPLARARRYDKPTLTYLGNIRDLDKGPKR